MRRYRYEGGLGKAMNMVNTTRSRGGSWTRKAKQHKAIEIKCRVCGSIVGLECDHIIPIHRGGTNDATNLQSLCKICHAEKTAKENCKKSK